MKQFLPTVVKIFPLLLLSLSAPVSAMLTTIKKTPEIPTVSHQPPRCAPIQTNAQSLQAPEQKCAALHNHDKQSQQTILAQMPTARDLIEQSQYQPYLGIATLTATRIKNIIAAVEWNNSGNSKDIDFYDIQSDQITATWPNAHTAPITALATLPNGNLISGANDGEENLKIWDTTTSKCLKTLSLKDGSFSALAALSDTLIAFGFSWSRRVYIWDTEKDSVSSYLKHQDPIAHLVVLKSGHLLSCDIFNTINVWDWHNGGLRCLCTTPPNYINALTTRNADSLTPCDGIDSMAIMPDGTLAIGYRGDIFFWEISLVENRITLSFVKKVTGEEDVLVALTVTPDNQLVAGFSRGLWNTWNLSDLKLKKGVTHGST